jgi:hypothetical protein
VSITRHRRPISDGSQQLPRRAFLFREVNEQIARLDGIWEASGPVRIMCECGTSGCVEHIEISAEEYEEVRRFPTHFLVTARHFAAEDDHVVRVTSRYVVVVEKVGSDAIEAIRLDPRRSDGGAEVNRSAQVERLSRRASRTQNNKAPLRGH